MCTQLHCLYALIGLNWLSGCTSEQKAAGVLGYTQVSWDNLYGQELQPSSADKHWANLTTSEKAAANVLGYTEKIWDNKSGKEKQPASIDKYWHWLSACGKCVLGRTWICAEICGRGSGVAAVAWLYHHCL